MVDPVELQRHIESRPIDPVAAYLLGAGAVWESAMGVINKSPVMKPGLKLLEIVAEHPDPHFRDVSLSARNQLAHANLFQEWSTTTGVVTKEDVYDTHTQLGGLLYDIGGEQDPERPNAMLEQYLAVVTLQTLLTRRGDPNHLALPDDPRPYYARITGKRAAPDLPFRRLPLLLTAPGGRQLHNTHRDTVNIGHNLWHGEDLVALPNPPSKKIRGNTIERERFAVQRTAALLIQEMNSESRESTVKPLSKDEKRFLDDKGRYYVRMSNDLAR